MRKLSTLLGFAMLLLGWHCIAPAQARIKPMSDEFRAQLTGGVTKAEAESLAGSALKREGLGGYRKWVPLTLAMSTGYANNALVGYFISPALDSTVVFVAVDEHKKTVSVVREGSYAGLPAMVSHFLNADTVEDRARQQLPHADFAMLRLMLCDPTGPVDCLGQGKVFWSMFDRTTGAEYIVSGNFKLNPASVAYREYLRSGGR